MLLLLQFECAFLGGVKSEAFDIENPAMCVLIRELVGYLVWLATQTRPVVLTQVRAVARYRPSLTFIHWSAALNILGYVKQIRSLGISFQRGSMEGVSLQFR